MDRVNREEAKGAPVTNYTSSERIIIETNDKRLVRIQAEVELTLGSQKLKHQVLFADIQNDGILGIDFLSQNGCDVLLSKDHLMLNGERLACFRSNADARATCCKVVLSESIEVPPESEVIAKGRPINQFDKDGIGILETDNLFLRRYGLLVENALVSPYMGTVP